MTEYAIFSDEGVIEDEFYSREEAEKALRSRYADEDDLWIEQVNRTDDGRTIGIHDEDEYEDCDEVL